MSRTLDDAAARALALALTAGEHVGLLYEDGGRILHTLPQGQGRSHRSHGRFSIPAGSLRGIYHTHPPEGDTFSRKDIQTAIRLGVPSYIAVGNEIRRYDPHRMDAQRPINQPGVSVLAEIPIEQIKRRLLANRPIWFWGATGLPVMTEPEGILAPVRSDGLREFSGLLAR